MTTTYAPSRSGPRTRLEAAEAPSDFRKPAYECRDRRDAVVLVVYVPGVAASGVDVEARGADVTITARKSRFVRVNWQSLHLEGAQRDYRLRLRLGNGFQFHAMHAEIRDGVLTVTVPKRQSGLGTASEMRRVA